MVSPPEAPATAGDARGVPGVCPGWDQALAGDTRAGDTAVEKWQLSSEDHASILKLLSTTLDDEVAAAVANVSGRS